MFITDLFDDALKATYNAKRKDRKTMIIINTSRSPTLEGIDRLSEQSWLGKLSFEEQR